MSFGKLRPWPNIGPSLCDSLSRWSGSPLTELIQIRSQELYMGPLVHRLINSSRNSSQVFRLPSEQLALSFSDSSTPSKMKPPHPPWECLPSCSAAEAISSCTDQGVRLMERDQRPALDVGPGNWARAHGT